MATATRIDRYSILLSLARRRFLEMCAGGMYQNQGQLADDDALRAHAEGVAAEYKVRPADILGGS